MCVCAGELGERYASQRGSNPSRIECSCVCLPYLIVCLSLCVDVFLCVCVRDREYPFDCVGVAGELFCRQTLVCWPNTRTNRPTDQATEPRRPPTVVVVVLLLLPPLLRRTCLAWCWASGLRVVTVVVVRLAGVGCSLFSSVVGSGRRHCRRVFDPNSRARACVTNIPVYLLPICNK